MTRRQRPVGRRDQLLLARVGRGRAQTGRPERRPASCASAPGSAGGGVASNLRLPATATRGAPRRVRRSASAALCAGTE
jgi:hypothetical protein